MPGKFNEKDVPDDLPNFVDRLRRLLTVDAVPDRTDEPPEKSHSIELDSCPAEPLLGRAADCQSVLKDDVPHTSNPNSKKAVSSVLVRDFVLSQECSVRLRNRATSDDLFAKWTLGDALARMDEFKSAALSVSGLGATSVQELLTLLQTPSTPSPEAPDDTFAIGARDTSDSARYTDLSADALRLPLSFVLAFSECSTRLRNALASIDIEHLSLSDFITDPEILLARLRDRKGVGKQTVTEVRQKIEDLIDRILAKDPVVQSFADECLGNGPSESADVEPLGEITTEEQESGKNIEQILAELPEREGHVLARRYGLGGHLKHTLEEIASDVHVTRERIRQLEAKALRRLGSPAHRYAMRVVVQQHRENIWNTLSGGNALITDTELREYRQDIDPLCALAIDVAYGNLHDWLATIATRTSTGWLLKEESLQRLDELTARLDIFGSDHPLPRPLASAASALELDLSSVDLACEHSTQLDNFEAYLCKGRVGTRTRRAVRLHQIAIEEFGTRLFDIASLIAAYRHKYPEDIVAPRIFQMQLEEAPHLFCKLFDCLWFALASHADAKSEASIPFERHVAIEPSFEEGSIGQELARFLADRPKRQVDLRALMAQSTSGQVADSSVGAILSSNPCFRRVAPGVFDLCRSGDVYNENGVLNEIFLDDRQCRAYCFARYGGAPNCWYPSWGPSLELWLTRWARLRAEPQLYRSLLYVGDPSIWPAPDDELEYWIRTKDREAAWLVGTPRRFELGRRFIEPSQFFCTLSQLAHFGWTSWMAVNRTTDAKGDVHDAADVLALLITAGLVAAPSDWQQPHLATEAVRPVFEVACREMHHRGRLDWDDGILAAMWSAIEENARSLETGWLQNSELSAALESWNAGQARTSRAFARKQLEPVDPAAIFETEDWGQLFG